MTSTVGRWASDFIWLRVEVRATTSLFEIGQPQQTRRHLLVLGGVISNASNKLTMHTVLRCRSRPFNQLSQPSIVPVNYTASLIFPDFSASAYLCANSDLRNTIFCLFRVHILLLALVVSAVFVVLAFVLHSQTAFVLPKRFPISVHILRHTFSAKLAPSWLSELLICTKLWFCACLR